jgi:hypothetical protein
MSRSSSTGRQLARLSVECLEDRTTPTFLSRGGANVINVNGATVPAGGLSIAAGDVLPDPVFNFFGLAEMEYVTGTGPGTESRVQIYSRTGQLRGQFTPFPGFRSGINVAVGDVLGGASPEILVSVAANGPPAVGVFTSGGQLLTIFLAFPMFYQGGVNIATGNTLGGIRAGGFSGGLVSGQFKQEIIIGTATSASFVSVTDGVGNVQRFFEAFPGFLGGVTVTAANVDRQRAPGFNFLPNQTDVNAYDEIIVGAATVTPAVSVFSAWEGTIIREQFYFAANPFSGQGVTVAAGSTDTIHGAEIYVALVGTSVVRAFDGQSGALIGEQTVYPAAYTRVMNMVVGYFTPGGYDPSDDNTLGSNSFDFDTLDLAIVTGDGSFQQIPRYYIGLPFAPAPFNGP